MGANFSADVSVQNQKMIQKWVKTCQKLSKSPHFVRCFWSKYVKIPDNIGPKCSYSKRWIRFSRSEIVDLKC